MNEILKMIITIPCHYQKIILNYFCYAECLAYYSLENKPSISCEYQPDELDDGLIQKNHEDFSYPNHIKLMISRERMWFAK